MNICLIPARSGSKRLKNKNIKLFCGKPIIAYSITVAAKSKLFDKIIVSTDSAKIAKIAEKYGAQVPFLRPKILSNDKAIDIEVTKHFIDYWKSQNKKINYLCYLYPTNPLLKSSTLKKCFKTLVKKNCDRVLTISEYSYPIQRALKKNKDGKVNFREKKYIHKRSQDLKNFYQDATQCYWYNMKHIKSFKQKLSTYSVELKRNEFIDINTVYDFRLAEQIYLLNKKTF